MGSRDQTSLWNVLASRLNVWREKVAHTAARSKELPSAPKEGKCPRYGSTYGKVGGRFNGAFFCHIRVVDSQRVTR